KALGYIAAGSLAFLGADSILLAFTLDGHAVNEWSAKLIGSDQAERKIDTALGASPEWALALVDGNMATADATISVNGHKMADKPRTIYLFNSADSGYSQFQIFACLFRQPMEAMRQWRAVKVPVSLLNLKGPNSITITPGPEPLTVYGGFPLDRSGSL